MLNEIHSVSGATQRTTTGQTLNILTDISRIKRKYSLQSMKIMSDGSGKELQAGVTRMCCLTSRKLKLTASEEISIKVGSSVSQI